MVDEFDRLFGGSDFEDQVSHVLAGIAKKKVWLQYNCFRLLKFSIKF